MRKGKDPDPPLSLMDPDPVPNSDPRHWIAVLQIRAGIFKPLWSPGIDARASIPPAYVAWRAGTITLFLLGA
jgi:hypothetical protein